jgi:calcium/calmodulin-dependent protein kinase I
MSSSPQTPPKKAWERHYRSFLQRGSSTTTTTNNTNKQQGHIPPPAIPPPPVLTKEKDTSKAEGSVRGGKLFGHVFHRGGGKAALDSPSNNLRHHRKHHSFSHSSTTNTTTDELDGTLRRGAEKSYSPGGHYHQRRGMSRVTSAEQDISSFFPSQPVLAVQRVVSEGRATATAQGRQQRSTDTALPPRLASEDFAVTSAWIPAGPASAALLAATVTAIAAPTTASLSRQDTKNNDIAMLDMSRSSSSAMKKVFTEFHNSAHTGQDSGHAFLGDDPSHRGHNKKRNSLEQWAPNQQLAAARPMSFQQYTLQQQVLQQQGLPSNISINSRLGGSISHNNLTHFNNHSAPLETVQESVAIKSSRILKPILGVDTWNHGRRYLIAPAALAACPLKVLTTLSGGGNDWTETFSARDAAGRESAFGTIVLGDALLTYMSVSQKTVTVQQWSSACLVLRQNYLLEYDTTATSQESVGVAAGCTIRGLPRGFCHLEYAVCHDHADFNDALELHFYASPCAKSDKRVLMIRVQQREEREYWKRCLNRAARLQLSDLFEYDARIPLGQGPYASVHPARRKDVTRGLSVGAAVDSGLAYNCALKIFDKKQFWRLVVKGRERADTLVRETSVQATLTANCGKVASFLRLRGFFETSDNVVLELELLEGTDLFKYISSKGVLSEDEAARITIDILKSLEAMNRIGLAHRDIKPANILLCHSRDQGPSVKVGDFGMSTFVGVDGQVRGRCGTPGYVAPEIFTAGVHGGYGNKVDVFSAGVTLYVMLCGYEPFYGETDSELVNANKAGRVEFTEDDWGGISMEARDLVKKMMNVDSAQRLNAKEALKHPWLQRQTQCKEDDVLDRSLTLPTSEAPSEDACTIS